MLTTYWSQKNLGLGKAYPSTDDVAFNLIDYVLKSVNQKMHVGGILCDLAKASDSKS
jgi:hypothetical protein